MAILWHYFAIIKDRFGRQRRVNIVAENWKDANDKAKKKVKKGEYLIYTKSI